MFRAVGAGSGLGGAGWWVTDFDGAGVGPGLKPLLGWGIFQRAEARC
jgi:hypothetical protein